MKKQWTTVADFVAYGKTNPKIDSIEVLGFDSKNDGGALTLYRTGSVGTPSQSFIDTGNNTCIDANGDVWGLVEGTTVTYNGVDDWLGNDFGSEGAATYRLDGGVWQRQPNAKVLSVGSSVARSLEERFSQEVNLKDFGALLDGVTDDTFAANMAATYAKGKNVTIVGQGEMLITSIVTLYNSCDFSQLKLIVDGGRLVFEDDRDSKYVVFDESAIDKTLLTPLQSQFTGVFTDSSVLVDYAESWYRINSPDTYLIRNNSGAYSPQAHNSVGLLNRYGRLGHSVNLDYSTASEVTITLYKNHPEQMHIKAPKEVEIRSSIGSVMSIQRNNTKIEGVTWSQVLTDDSIFEEDTGTFLRINSCMNVVVEGFTTSGIGVPSKVGLSDQSRYDLIYNFAVNVIIRDVASHTSWKTFDGNNSRQILVEGGYMDSLHAHFNCSDITIRSIKVLGEAISASCSADDSTILMDDVTFENYSSVCFSVRVDYGELRGDVIMRNCRANKVDTSTNFGENTIINLNETAIYGSSGTAGAQPAGRVYKLPKRVIIDGFTLNTSLETNLVRLPEQRTYASDELLEFPSEIILSDINVEGSGLPIIHANGNPYNRADMEPLRISLTRVRGRLDQPVALALGKSDFTDAGELPLAITVEDSCITGTYYSTGTTSVWKVPENSTLRVCNSDIYGGIDMYSGSNTYFGEASIHNSTFHITDAVQAAALSLSGRYVKIVGCTFDGTKHLETEGTIPVIEQRVHMASGNVAINCGTSNSAYDQDSNLSESSGRNYPVNGVGGYKNYSWVSGDTTLTPTWTVGKHQNMIGTAKAAKEPLIATAAPVSGTDVPEYVGQVWVWAAQNRAWIATSVASAAWQELSFV